MDTTTLGASLTMDRQIRCTPQAVDMNLGKIYDKMYSASRKKGWVHMQEKRTHTNPFTEKEIALLRNNPNVEHVSSSTIRFTPEFKQYFYEAYSSGRRSPEIFRGAGIDPKILGQDRIDGFRYTVMKSHRQDEYDSNTVDGDPTGHEATEASEKQKIRQLEHELAYVKQEVELLKKLHLANMEARESWELKHRRK